MNYKDAISDAIFSEDREFRYGLMRTWNPNKPRIMFIGLNPSTADETANDPTIRRVIKFADSWGYGGVIMANLFPLVTANPKDLREFYSTWHYESEDTKNLSYIERFAAIVNAIVFCWGNFPEAKTKAKQIISKYEGWALVVNKDGSPRHPLYVPANTQPIRFN